MKTIFAAALLSTALSPVALAQDSEGWTGNADVNALVTSGNTSQTSFGLSGKATYASGLFRHTVGGYYDFNKSSGETDRERFGADYNLAYDFSEKLFFTATVAYDNDKFGSFRQRFSANAGLGYKAITKKNFDLTLEAAPSVIFTQNLSGEDYVTNYAALGRSTLNWKITDTTTFKNITEINLGGRTLIENKSAIQFKITKALSSKLSYDIRYDNDAPADRRKTDTIFRAGLSYGF
ncbi:DUF481 domain-containing protein [Kordiimonas sp. SCSIO 12603]|uniref:DUF481 domain-containing protein n=1 Tax=Kordiimonas sp. SCSIO 12603 TaxID=2829596 RepID=UPI002101FD0C|nr:DUF481 domain-containing protein [Kordiimonas sp. SCSIO 12603]UTW57814.1 DUF481 domain-containing protein [Kordiimonas sp. SCSIO 12603]